MAARTTSTLVETIIVLPAGTDLSGAIATATALVDQCCLGLGYSDAMLELIERWLAAHFAAIMNPGTKSEKLGAAMDVYESGKLGDLLRFTRWGQQALVLDTEGGLTAADATDVSVIWAGLPDTAWPNLGDSPYLE